MIPAVTVLLQSIHSLLQCSGDRVIQGKRRSQQGAPCSAVQKTLCQVAREHDLCSRSLHHAYEARHPEPQANKRSSAGAATRSQHFVSRFDPGILRQPCFGMRPCVLLSRKTEVSLLTAPADAEAVDWILSHAAVGQRLLHRCC